jgi:hypothetical protein
MASRLSLHIRLPKPARVHDDNYMIERILSRGQTGADQGAWRAAKAAGLSPAVGNHTFRATGITANPVRSGADAMGSEPNASCRGMGTRGVRVV